MVFCPWLPGLAGTLIDDFEAPASFARWTFYNGAEFPGATGSLIRAAGHFGAGARLGYDFTGGGAYVSAKLILPAPLTGAALAFWVKSPASVRVRLRVGDTTGQVLQYNLNRPLWQMDPAAWYRHIVPLDSPNGWWGGTNDGRVHFPIKDLSILAGDALEAGAAGAIDFDDVELLDTLAVTLDPLRQPVVAALADSGSLASRLGVNIHFTSDDRALDAARSAGIQWVRMDLAWSSVEPQTNTFNWTAFDGLVRSLEARAMNALFILDYGHPLYTGGNAPTNAEQIAAFARYAETAARHFAGHSVVFEIWNEPNISFWKPAPDTNQYAALARAVIPAVKRGDPAAKVLTGGLSGFDHKFARGYLSLGGGDGADGIGVHPYLRSPETMTDHLLNLRATVAQLVPGHPPVYDTEWGFSSTWYGDGHDPAAQHRQGMMAPRRLLASWAAGLPLMIYYDIRDDGLDSTNAEHNFGLLLRDYSDKPAMQAVRTLSAFTSNRLFTGFLPMDTSTLVAMRLDGPSNVVVALWPSTDAADVPVTVPANSSAVDLLGRPLPLEPSTNGWLLTVRQTNSPVYLTVLGPGRATNVTLVSTGAVWRYLDTGTNLGTNWITPGFDDRAWGSGRAPLGYGDAGLGTTNSYGTNANNKFITTYYRRQFVVRGAAGFGELRLRLLRDDGAVIYLNGEEALVSNLPGQPAFNTFALTAIAGADETNWVTAFLPPSLLVEGTNVLAVEVHQANATSTDLRFDLELRGAQAWLPPTFATLPALPPVETGSLVTLTAGHDGVSPFTYQWWFNGTNLLAGQTNAQLLLTNAQPLQSGAYQVVVSNRFGSVTSAAASLLIAPPLRIVTNFVAAGAVWRYRDNAVDQGTVWRGVNFNDAAWPSGPAQLGFGDQDEATLIASNRQWTTYFRRAFQVADAALVETLNARLIRDDGAVVYLNGTEVWRSNLPTNTTVLYSTPASQNLGVPDENTWLAKALDPAALRNGTNVVAVEIHQNNLTSSDLSFDFELSGTVRAFAQAELRVSWSEGRPVLTWPLEAGLLPLLTATNLAPPIAWLPATNAPVLVDGQWTIVLPVAAEPQRFFRLDAR